MSYWNLPVFYIWMKMDNPKNNDKLKKVSKIMEKFWLVIAIVSFLVVLYFFFTDGINRVTLQFLVFPALAGAMYAFRLTFRKRLERRENE